MTIIRRKISPGHHIGIWRQQPGRIIVDLWSVRLEFISDTTNPRARI